MCISQCIRALFIALLPEPGPKLVLFNLFYKVKLVADASEKAPTDWTNFFLKVTSVKIFFCHIIALNVSKFLLEENYIVSVSRCLDFCTLGDSTNLKNSDIITGITTHLQLPLIDYLNRTMSRIKMKFDLILAKQTSDWSIENWKVVPGLSMVFIKWRYLSDHVIFTRQCLQFFNYHTFKRVKILQIHNWYIINCGRLVNQKRPGFTTLFSESSTTCPKDISHDFMTI